MNECIYFLSSTSVTETWKSWEMLLDFKVFINALVWKSVMFGLVGLHLCDEVHEMLWLLEQLKLFGVNKVT